MSNPRIVSTRRLLERAERDILDRFEHQPILTLKQIKNEVRHPETEILLGLQDLIDQGLVVVTPRAAHHAESECFEIKP
jgi:predicted transcriptional regulator